jgi:hypothetical protein
MTVGRPVNVAVDPYISDLITRSGAREKGRPRAIAGRTGPRLEHGYGIRPRAAPVMARPCETSADQLCQRNCCGFLAEPCESTTLTRAGLGKFFASSRRPRRSFGSLTKKSLPPGACPGEGRGLPSSGRSGRRGVTPYAKGRGIERRSGRRSAAECPRRPIALRAGDRRVPCGSAADWRSPRHARR